LPRISLLYRGAKCKIGSAFREFDEASPRFGRGREQPSRVFPDSKSFDRKHHRNGGRAERDSPIRRHCYAVPESLSLDGISPHSVKTNRDGTFNFGEKLEWGTYKLYARKDKDAYPDPLDRFYADAKLATATADLAEANPSKEVTIMLGEKAGVITGRVVDADTGAPLKARIAFIDEDGNGHSVSSQSKTGEYYALVPAEKDVIVMVDVYSPHHRRTEVPFPHLQLEFGQEVVLDIPVLKN
jgi:hypothetical protein